MDRMIHEADVVSIKLVQRVRGERETFTDFFITTLDGRSFYSRRMYPIADTPHSKANEIQQFLRRQNR